MQRKYAREVRAAVLALVPVVLATPAAGAGGSAGKVAFLDRGMLRVVDLATGSNSAGRAANYYGHYDWPDLVAVSP